MGTYLQNDYKWLPCWDCVAAERQARLDASKNEATRMSQLQERESLWGLAPGSLTRKHLTGAV